MERKPSAARPLKMSLPLTYQQEVFREAYHDDTLVVMARGLGLCDIVANILHSYDATGRSLVLLVGASELENTRFGEQLAEKAAVSRTPNARGLLVINTNVSSVASREKMYVRGGVFTITSRILIVDLLAGLLDPSKITGLVVLHAERVTAVSLEAFIIRIFRQKNKTGFLKAFSERPETFSSGFSALSTIMRNLFLQKTSLWPRYHVRVAQSLEARKAEVVELEISMTPAMQSIQNSALQCIEISISELRKVNLGLDIGDWSVDSALHRSFDILIRRQLEPVWHRVSPRTKQIASDLTTLRTILLNLLSLDAVSFHQYLETVLASNAPTNSLSTLGHSPWLYLDAADTLFSLARRRVYTGSLPKSLDPTSLIETGLVLEELPKWDVLLNILDEIYQNRQGCLNKNKNGPVLIMCHDRQTCVQIAEYLQFASNLTPENDRQEQTGRGYSSKYMRQKFASFHAWKVAFSRARSSKLLQDYQETSSKPTLPLRKVPPNKRRRLRGGAQLATTSRDHDRSFDTGKSEYSANPDSRNNLEIPFEEGIFEAPECSATDFEMHDPKDSLVIHPYSAADDSLLEEIQPQDVIMYSPNASFIRHIEVYRSSHSNINDIRAYFMYYGCSVEEQTYLSTVRKEKDAFTNLIRQKSSMATTLTVDSFSGEDPQDKFLRTLNTRIAGGGRLIATAEPPRVVVDVREFRSSLPSLLHGKNITIVPCSLTVGDYILSPNICVERKSVKDLISSFKDGRLYSQAEAMISGYQEPVLLVEFDQDKSFSLEPFTDLNSTAAAARSDLQAKLVLLTLHFPKLRIIWSSSPYQTAEIFEELKKNEHEPDPLKAVSIGLADGEDGYSTYAPTPMEILKAIPGITEQNYKQIVLEVDNIMELGNVSENNLTAIIGPEAARRVHGFFDTNMYIS
ncbi:hypothetical protein TWF569_002120 [Orbilia oligospora]|uniref:ERCC4 domain-containing protein n=1 Tax=Orbilia oligospora TaxID=2813651 RepID=A0A7C8NFP4_ORBOL|nr:hypothetical protein TWF102_003174 [Orbilia oligospora]KAF3084285.1 hypothetical protein TWF103_002586 [Orbilia oligospora]KAF3122586.1 hypothetical protein TWF569_002120 [Orbilia oligospora]KAF3127676.1 hypothetical protein TWF594_000608 [Orbilia oligospora]